MYKFSINRVLLVMCWISLCRHYYTSCSDRRMFFLFKQKTAYELRISDWSSDVCSSDLRSRLQEQEDGWSHGGSAAHATEFGNRPYGCRARPALCKGKRSRFEGDLVAG